MSKESYETAITNGIIEESMPFEIWEKCHRDIISVVNVPCMDGVHFARVIICTVNSIVNLNVEWGEVNPERYTTPAIHQLVNQFIKMYKNAIGCPFVGVVSKEGAVIKTWDESAVEADAWYINWRSNK